jgi:hypothetical protein
MLGRTTSPRGKEAVPRQCWVSAEALCRPQASDMLRRPYSAKRKGSRQEQCWRNTFEIKDVWEETTVVLGVKQENKLPRFKTTTTSADEEDIRQVPQDAHAAGEGESKS